MSGQTLFQKLWDAHVVHVEADGTTLLYIDRHLVHEVTSPQAFEGLKLAHRTPRRTDAAIAVPDHNVPTTDRSLGIADPISRLQVETLDANCAEFGITEFKMDDIRQGIVHVIGPEEGPDPARHDRGVRRFAHRPRMARSARWRSASAPPRSSTCWPRNACGRNRRRPCWSKLKVRWARA
jgi:hypothetical protein